MHKDVEAGEVKRSLWQRIKDWLPVPLTKREWFIDTVSSARSYIGAGVMVKAWPVVLAWGKASWLNISVGTSAVLKALTMGA